MLRAATQLALQREGFVVHGASDVADAIRLLTLHPRIAAGVLEIELGHSKQNGLAFAGQARRLKPDFGIVLLTGRADLLLGRATHTREVHLLKPSAIERVAEMIRRVLT